MATADLNHEQQDEREEHLGGGRFNLGPMIIFISFAVVGGVAAGYGIQSSGNTSSIQAPKSLDDSTDSSRSRGEIEDLAAHGATPHAKPTTSPAVVVLPRSQQHVQHTSTKTPNRYAQWAQEKYMKALESPEMVSAFHAGQTLEVGSAKQPSSDQSAAASGSEGAVTLHPPASPYTVMAGSVVPAVLVSGINSDLAGPILAQVSEGVFDTATGKYLLIPQGSKLIGAYENASIYGQERVRIAWQRLIFPNTSSMDLPQMPGADSAGYAGFTDQVDHHYLGTFGTAALMSVISAGQMVGQMAAFGGGGTYGPYGYYQPNQWAMSGEMTGSTASGQFGALGQQMMSRGMNRPPTIEVRPGYQFTVMVTHDLVMPGPYKN